MPALAGLVVSAGTVAAVIHGAAAATTGDSWHGWRAAAIWAGAMALGVLITA